MPRHAARYDADFFAWTMEQARLLRSGEFSQLDVENLAEELESIGRSDKRALDNRLTALLVHLLKWKVQELHRSRSWSGTIREQRRQIEKLLRESPSLRPVIDQLLAEAYAGARDKAADETGLVETMFPIECPFSIDEILSPTFLPE
jgi:hypothetical protein